MPSPRSCSTWPAGPGCCKSNGAVVTTKTRVISAKGDLWLPEALAVVRDGGLVAFPTDTVYGLGGLASKAEAVEAIFLAKARPEERSIPILVAGWTEVRGVALPAPPAERLAAAFWPGPLTIVMERDPSLPAAIGPTRIGIDLSSGRTLARK